MEIKEIIRTADLFAGLTEAQIEAVVAICRPVACAAGEVIFEEDVAGHDLFILPRGRVAIEIRLVKDAMTEQIYQVKDHEVFGELSLLDGHKRSARTRALDALELIKIDRADLLGLMERDRDLGYLVMSNLARILANKLRDTNMSLRNLIVNQKVFFGGFH